jgi:hypothetical protein
MIIRLEEYQEFCIKFSKVEFPYQRFGQAFINHFAISGSNSELYYEESKDKARAIIEKDFVNVSLLPPAPDKVFYLCQGQDGFVFASELDDGDYCIGSFFVSVGDLGPQPEYLFKVGINNKLGSDMELKLVEQKGGIYSVKTPGGTIDFRLRNLNVKYAGKSNKVPEGDLWAMDPVDGEELEMLCQMYNMFFLGEGE